MCTLNMCASSKTFRGVMLKGALQMTLKFIEGLGFHASIIEWVGCISQGVWKFEGLLCENIVNVVDHLRTISYKHNDIINQQTTKIPFFELQITSLI